MEGFSRKVIFYRDGFFHRAAVIDQYSPGVYIPVFRGPMPETGSIALRASQNGQKFSAEVRFLEADRRNELMVPLPIAVRRKTF
jgi:hypothetical protein